MSITSSDITYYHPVSVSRLSTNGGVRSYNIVNFSKLGDLVPPASMADAASGVTLYTKCFAKLTNTSDEALYSSYVGFFGLDSQDDSYYMALGTSESTQSDAVGYSASDWAVGGLLKIDVSAGAVSIDITTEDGAGIDSSNMCYLDDGVNAEIFPVSNVSFVGSTATLTVDSSYNGGSGLMHSYTAASTSFSSLLNVGTVTTSWTEDANTNGLTITGDVETYNAGTITESYRVIFSGSTTYDIYKTSDLVTPILTGGSISADVSVQNTDEATGHYLFTIPSGFFSGANASDVYDFSTSAAEIPIWIKRVVPAGANSGVVSGLSIQIVGEAV